MGVVHGNSNLTPEAEGDSDSLDNTVSATPGASVMWVPPDLISQKLLWTCIQIVDAYCTLV